MCVGLESFAKCYVPYTGQSADGTMDVTWLVHCEGITTRFDLTLNILKVWTMVNEHQNQSSSLLKMLNPGLCSQRFWFCLSNVGWRNLCFKKLLWWFLIKWFVDKILRSTVVNSGWDLKRQRLHAPDITSRSKGSDYGKGQNGWHTQA